MVLLQLILIARTENVGSIEMPQDGEWHCKIKCGGCGQTFPKEITVSRTERIQVIKEQVNFCAKCKNCNRKSTILILPTSPYRAEADQNGNIKCPIAAFDCRGLDILEVVLGNSLTVNSSSGQAFQNADFSDLWAQYDDKIGGLCQVEDPKILLNRK